MHQLELREKIRDLTNEIYHTQMHLLSLKCNKYALQQDLKKITGKFYEPGKSAIKIWGEKYDPKN